MTLLNSLNLDTSTLTSITSDSRLVTPGALFLAYPGTQNDGRHYIPQAIQAGAAIIIWEMDGFTWDKSWQVRNAPVLNLKQQVGVIAAEYYGDPSKQLTMVGVTGTNGKTSVSQWLAQCLSHLGQKTAVLGTIGNGVMHHPASFKDTKNTTPDAILLQAMLADFVAQNTDAVVMEVSSHGLDQGRVNGIAFDIAVLTNLTRDHLDYHSTMQAYSNAKRKLFEWDGLRAIVLNSDDAFGLVLVQQLNNIPCFSYGFESLDSNRSKLSKHIAASHLQLHANGLSMQVQTPHGTENLTAEVLGRFNAYNVLAVLSTLLALNIELKEAVAAIGKIKPVIGRMQQFGGGALPLVVVDYAHTPDALENVLTTLKEQINATFKAARLICVFGCGGERDAGKRSLMGAVASTFADSVIVTSDNPRSESPTAIINQIVTRMTAGYVIEADRAKAIVRAIHSANSGDIVVVAGKGHEDYQEISGLKHPFSDAGVVLATLEDYQALPQAAHMKGAIR